MSEGHASAQAILKYHRQFRPYPTTIPELEVQETEQQRIRRVLSGGCNHDCNQGRNCDCDDNNSDRMLGSVLLIVGAPLVVIALTSMIVWVAK